jgi:hypothetical protein
MYIYKGIYIYANAGEGYQAVAVDDLAFRYHRDHPVRHRPDNFRVSTFGRHRDHLREGEREGERERERWREVWMERASERERERERET